MGSLCLICVHPEERQNQDLPSSGKQLFIITLNRKIISFLFTFLFLWFLHTCLLRIEVGTIWFQEYVKAVRASCQVGGVIITSKDWRPELLWILKRHHSGDKMIHPFPCWQDSNLVSMWRVTYSDNKATKNLWTGLFYFQWQLFSIMPKIFDMDCLE